MFKSASTSLIVLGVLAILAGIIALAWPGITILALVVLFAIYAFSDALAQAMRAPAKQARLSRLVRQPTTDVVALDVADAISVGVLLAASEE